MNEGTLAECFTFLSAMNCGSEQRWSARLKSLYGLVLRRLDDEAGRRAVNWAVLHEEWRPSPARLLEIAAETASPIPDAEAAYAEIMHQAQSEGLYACPLPERPSVKVVGPPDFSHPVVARIVRYCGGWEMICTGESNMAEGLKKQVRGAHEAIAREWREAVKRQLFAPLGERDPKLFPRWKPYALPEDWSDAPLLEDQRARAIEARRQEAVEEVPMPPELKKLLQGIGWKVPSTPFDKGFKGRNPTPTQEDKARIRAEAEEMSRGLGEAGERSETAERGKAG